MGPIPADVEQFLVENIESFDQLEILRVLGDLVAREWAPDELAREIQADPQVVASHLGKLQRRGLLVCDNRPTGLVCRYGPQNPDLEERVRRLLEVYRERPVTLIKMVYARENARLRAFAEAFRIRKET